MGERREVMGDREEQLITAAKEVMARAHCPYSGFHVGAALEAEDGAVFAGCNVESASYGGTICAERTALVSAVAAGRRKFSQVVVVSDSPEPVAPCGLCRQLLAEFGLDLKVIAVGGNGKRASWRLSELLPHAFTSANLAEGA
jgi:cytidine deaminase